jgi:hypothetical protein
MIRVSRGGCDVQRFKLGGLGGRFVVALVLVMATYNPTGYCFLGWVAATFPHIQPLQAVIGLALLGFWIFFTHATWQSLGTVGVVLGLAFTAALIWLTSSWGWFSMSNHVAVAWAILLVVTCLLTLGMSWGFMRAKASGQVLVDEVRR